MHQGSRSIFLCNFSYIHSVFFLYRTQICSLHLIILTPCIEWQRNGTKTTRLDLFQTYSLSGSRHVRSHLKYYNIYCRVCFCCSTCQVCTCANTHTHTPELSPWLSLQPAPIIWSIHNPVMWRHAHSHRCSCHFLSGRLDRGGNGEQIRSPCGNVCYCKTFSFSRGSSASVCLPGLK